MNRRLFNTFLLSFLISPVWSLENDSSRIKSVINKLSVGNKSFINIGNEIKNLNLVSLNIYSDSKLINALHQYSLSNFNDINSLRNTISHFITTDYEHERIVNIYGWQVSRTEAELSFIVNELLG